VSVTNLSTSGLPTLGTMGDFSEGALKVMTHGAFKVGDAAKVEVPDGFILAEVLYSEVSEGLHAVGMKACERLWNRDLQELLERMNSELI